MDSNKYSLIFFICAIKFQSFQSVTSGKKIHFIPDAKVWMADLRFWVANFSKQANNKLKNYLINPKHFTTQGTSFHATPTERVYRSEKCLSHLVRSELRLGNTTNLQQYKGPKRAVSCTVNFPKMYPTFSSQQIKIYELVSIPVPFLRSHLTRHDTANACHYRLALVLNSALHYIMAHQNNG